MAYHGPPLLSFRPPKRYSPFSFIPDGNHVCFSSLVLLIICVRKPSASRMQRGKKSSYNNQQLICIHTLDVWPYSRLFIPLISENDATLHGTIIEKRREGRLFWWHFWKVTLVQTGSWPSQLLRPDPTDQFLGGQEVLCAKSLQEKETNSHTSVGIWVETENRTPGRWCDSPARTGIDYCLQGVWTRWRIREHAWALSACAQVRQVAALFEPTQPISTNPDVDPFST